MGICTMSQFQNNKSKLMMEKQTHKKHILKKKKRQHTKNIIVQQNRAEWKLFTAATFKNLQLKVLHRKTKKYIH